jgi:CheY-like chemotaxis protein
MGHLFSFIETTPPSPQIEPLEPTLPPPSNINASSKSALLVESDESLTICFRQLLQKDGYAVRLASDTEEGLRLFRECGPFNVVLINYYVPEKKGTGIDCLVPQIHGVRLAVAIRNMNPSQGIIIVALDYQCASDVPRPAEVVHIPVLIDTGNGQLRSLLEKIEVDRAIKSLTSSDLRRLQLIAKSLVRGLGRAARGRDWEDLLVESQYRTLIGAEDNQRGRHWNKKVTFVQHLAGAMKSIASVWKRQFREQSTYLASEISLFDDDGQEQSPFDNVPSSSASPDGRLAEKSEADRLLAALGDDREAAQVLQAIMEGLKKNEINAKLDLDEKKYAAVMKRIRLKLVGRNRSKNNG